MLVTFMTALKIKKRQQNIHGKRELMKIMVGT